MNHSELCDLAVKWLKKPHSSGGPACQVAVSEIKSGWSGEIPDAIGFRYMGGEKELDGSFVVEVKTSRADFLADKRKPHRNGQTSGIGKWRFYLCPEGLIQPDELPDQWGLLYVTKRKSVKGIVSPFTTTHYYQRRNLLNDMSFDDRDLERELFMLTRLLKRVGDVNELNKKMKELFHREQRAIDKYNEIFPEYERLRRLEISLKRKGII